jgi:hypothetical protein
MVVENIGAEALQRAVRVGYGGHRLALRETADSSLSLGLNGSRPLDDQRVGLEDTPSRGKISKETLSFFY